MMKNSLTLLLLFLTLPLLSDSYSFKAGRSFRRTVDGVERNILQDGAEVFSDSTTIKAEEIEVYGNNNRFTLARESVEIQDTEKGYFVLAEEVFFDRERNYTRIKDNAIMEDRENELIVRGEFMEIYDDQDLIIIQIQVRILKEDLVCRSEMARFDRANDLLILTGLPVVFYKGDEYRASEITINIETEEIFLEGQVSGELNPQDQEEAGESAPTESQTSSEPSPETPEGIPGGLPDEK
jgi:lipopolysaccharide export system protein LptA